MMKKTLFTLALLLACITVPNVFAYEIYITADSSSVLVDDTLELKCVIKNMNEIPNGSLHWVSSNESIVRIMTSDSLRAVHPQLSSLPQDFYSTASIYGVSSGEATLVALYKGDTTQFFVTVRPNSAIEDSTSTGSTQYRNFIAENKRWVEREQITDITDSRPPEEQFTFKFFRGDTMLNNRMYHILYSQRFYSSDGSTLEGEVDSTLQSPTIEGFFREDTAERKVYKYPKHNTEYEELLYDFSLEIGDSILTSFGGLFILDTLYDVELNDGTLRSKYLFINPGDELDQQNYIVGIGGSNGIVDPFHAPSLIGTSYGCEIICYSENSVALYGTCNYPGFSDPTTYLFNIMPDPVNVEKGEGKEAKINTNFPMYTVNETLKWSVEDSTIAELIEIDTFGAIWVAGLNEGSTWLHASIAGLNDSVMVNVFQDTVPDTSYFFTITPDPVNLEKGEGKEAKINTNFPMHTVNEILMWTVEDSTIAELIEIDTYGAIWVAGLNEGSTWLHASIAGLKDSVLVNVFQDTVPDTTYYFSITPDPVNVKKEWGKEAKINTNFPMHTVNEILMWTIEDSTIAELIEIDTYGAIWVAGLNEGSTWLHASIAGLKDSVLVNVYNAQDTTQMIEQTMHIGTRKKLSELFPEVDNNMRFKVNTNDIISFDMALNVYANSPGTIDIKFYNVQNTLKFIGRITVTHVDTMGVEILNVKMIGKREVSIEFNADIVVNVDALIRYILDIKVIDNDSISNKSAEIMSISNAWITGDMRTLHILLSRDINPNESIVISCNRGLATTYNQEVNFSIEVGKRNATNLKEAQALNLHVFPNPVRDHVQIEADNDIESVKVYNFKGTLQNVTHSINSNELDVSKLSKGMYYIVVKDINGQSATHKIVKL